MITRFLFEQAKPVCACFVLASMPACSVILPVDEDQCSTDSDCRRRGGAFGASVCVARVCRPPTVPPDASGGDADLDADAPGDARMSDDSEASGDANDGVDADAGFDPVWGCLGRTDAGIPEPGKKITLTYPYVDLFTNKPVAGITVRTCADLDVDCENPIATDVVTGNDGLALLTVASGFRGHFVAFGPGLLSTLNFIGWPVTEDVVAPPIPMTTPKTLELLASALGRPYDQNLGTAVVRISDCGGQFAPGVMLRSDTLDKSTDDFYFHNGFPSANVTETDEQGVAGFVNLPTGFVTITASVSGTGKKIAAATILIQSQYMTYDWLVPYEPNP